MRVYIEPGAPSMTQEMLLRFLRCETTAEEEKKILDWIEESPSNRQELERLDMMLQAASLNDDIIAKNVGKDNAARTSGRRPRLLVRLAAAAAVIAVAMFAGYTFSGRGEEGQCEIVADRGQKSEVSLPDGSRIWLNSGSRISYSTGFGRSDRDIRLSGEAYFEVAKNKKLPFIVSTGDMTVRALGTVFNVCSYEDEKETVTLVEGSVLTTAGDSEAVLAPSQRIVYDRASGRLGQPETVNDKHLVPWKSNEIILDGNTLAEISVMLERLYNVDVKFASEGIKDYSYTGRIPNNSLKNILDLISGTTPVTYHIHDNIITLTSGRQ